ncbi:universal stress protein [Terasakiella sp. A23]|uniref:universal stress protein n=1 Tax=Terasakiella sp. FCG-A23 TaxID=3080561 RepID=UPI0029543D46|nr:universal stress protein [Terasakiella sp. A23]MDV7340496.1 universal stress protein [Terasakiella sp. A23]
MKRFKNILAIYDMGIGAEETLDKAISLARQNEADLNVLHVVDQKIDMKAMVAERKHLMRRLFLGVELEGRVNVIVKSGDQLEETLACVEEEAFDLIVTPTEYSSGWAQLLGTDLTPELMRRTNCPIWVVRPGQSTNYRKIVAAVNAGKEDALTCPINRRILEMASSLAKREGAALDILFAWEFEGTERDMLLSELPDEVRFNVSQEAHYQALEKVVTLTKQVLGEPLVGTPIAKHGDMEDVVIDYLKESTADLLVTEGSPGNPLVNAIVGNRTLRLINQAHCSVLISRPEPESAMMRRLGRHPSRGVDFVDIDRRI